MHLDGFGEMGNGVCIYNIFKLNLFLGFDMRQFSKVLDII